MSNRGMKKWAPFSSLVEQSTVLEEMFYEKGKQEKPSISSERAAKINQILTNYHGETLRISYYYDGYVYQLVSPIKRVDTYNRKLIFEERNIAFTNIVNIDYEY